MCSFERNQPPYFSGLSTQRGFVLLGFKNRGYAEAVAGGFREAEVSGEVAGVPADLHLKHKFLSS